MKISTWMTRTTRSRITAMETLVNDPNFDLERFAESLAKDGREGVKWERRKLEWILEEEKQQQEQQAGAKSETA
jgi:hypothetical protein